ncbi:unnamed protein product [Parajaminaea phylloscopi]
MPKARIARGVAALLIRAATSDSDEIEDLRKDQQENAEELLSTAAERHESLRKHEDYTASRNALEASQFFCLAKHQFARRTDNKRVAEWALDTAVGEAEATHDQLPLATVYRTSKVCVEYGAYLLVSHDQGEAAVEWIRRAVKLLERIEGGHLPQVAELQAEALRRLARAFYQHALRQPEGESTRSDALMSAEATLGELQRLYRASGSPLADDHRMTLLLFEIVASRGGDPHRLIDLLQSLGGRAELWTEEEVACVLGVVRSQRTEDVGLVGDLLTTLLGSLLRNPTEQHHLIERTLLITLTMCKLPSMLLIAQSIVDLLAAAEYPVSRDGSFAAQMLLWKFADARLRGPSPERTLAARLYRLAAQPIFSEADHNMAKSARKAALCHLEAGDLADAFECLHHCPPHLVDDAVNHYLRFAIFAKQGKESEAFTALNALLSAPNFTSNLLPSIVQVAQQAGLHELLYQALRSIAERAQDDSTLANSVDIVVLTRSLIKHHLPEGKGESMDAQSAQTLLGYLETNLQGLRKAAAKNAHDRKTCLEAEWSYKTTYNVAIGLSSSVDPELVAQFFDMSLALARVRETLLAEPLEAPAFQTTKVWAKLPAIVGRASVARDDARHLDTQDRRIMWFKIKDETNEAFELVSEAQRAADSTTLLKEVEWALVLLQYEATIRLRDWPAATYCFQNRAAGGLVPLSILEAMTDLTWGESKVSDALLSTLLRANIDVIKEELMGAAGATPSVQPPDVARMARLIRGLISFTLYKKTTATAAGSLTLASRNTQEEALSLLKDVLEMLRTDSPPFVSGALTGPCNHTAIAKAYPEDEKAWLVATAWDTGVELYNCGDFPLAKMYCETALSLASVQEGAEGKADEGQPGGTVLQQMRAQYSQLVTRLEGHNEGQGA